MGASRTAEQPSCDPLSPRGQCRIPQVMGSIPQDRPTPFRPWSSSPGCHLSSWASDRRLQEPPASDLINLLVGLPELRERFTYHITGLLEKDTVQEQPGERRAGPGTGRAGGFPALSGSAALPNLQMFSDPEGPQTLSFGRFMEASLPRRD